MTFKELLNSVTFDEVAPCLLQMHPDAEGNLTVSLKRYHA